VAGGVRHRAVGQRRAVGVEEDDPSSVVRPTGLGGPGGGWHQAVSDLPVLAHRRQHSGSKKMAQENLIV
jgi:hypothetical protein